jgi:hypothetical protein
MSRPLASSSIPPKSSVPSQTISAIDKSTTTNEIDSTTTNEIDCNSYKAHDKTAPSNNSNCTTHGNPCVASLPANVGSDVLENHRLDDNLSEYANFDVRDAFWPPPIFTWQTIPGTEERECIVSYDYSVPYDPNVTSWVFSPK